MMQALTTFLEVGLFLCALGCGWVLTVLNLPGNWLILGASTVYAAIMPEDSRWTLSWQLVAVLAVAAVLGEVAETASAAMGVKRLGGSRRGALLAIVGSFVGAIVGTAAIPVPIVGTVVGACAGSLVGAMLGEFWKGQGFDHSLRVGQAAFWGRLLGSLAKISTASVMIAVAVAGVFFR
ncbi:MAG: DUF456 domain-containing protein [Planctomycetia bacterium]|nr:DUF456 domain-containing protein [Planctomycetia bacterium]